MWTSALIKNVSPTIFPIFCHERCYRKSADLECERQMIISYLVDVESWTLQEIQLFGNTVDLLDNDHNFLFFKKVSKMLEYYIDMEKGREIYCALMINLIEYTLKHQQYDATEVLVVQLKLLATDYKEFFHQLKVFPRRVAHKNRRSKSW